MREPIVFQPEYTPEMFLEQIDIKFERLKGKEDRLSLAWGHFSRGMNLEIRKYCKELPMQSLIREQYVHTMMYWTCKSKLLDLHMKHKLLGQGKIKREQRMAKDLKEKILSGKFLDPIDENKLVNSILGD